VNRANIFSGLKATGTHAPAPEDVANTKRLADSVRAAGGFVAKNPNTGNDMVMGQFFVRPQLDSIVKARGGTGAPTAADSATLHANLQTIVDRMIAAQGPAPVPGVSAISPFRQCHDITVYPSLGLAGGACEGHGFLLDIKDPVNPVRLDAVSDSNFAYWHSATFNNDGTKLLFSDEWGGGGAPKCRATDKKEWGSDAIFLIENRKLKFQSYYKLPAAQTDKENCVAHNGSLIPIPGRTIMVQAWYQGGLSLFEWTDPKHPHEIGFFDRGPNDGTRAMGGGFWSVYWYNGLIIGSEMQRGLDIFELTPSAAISKNELDAAKSVHMDFLNAQDQQKFEWPATFALSRAYTDQLERWKGFSADQVSAVRAALSSAEAMSGGARKDALNKLAGQVSGYAGGSTDPQRVAWLSGSLKDLANATK
jgi:hypothetical protein